MVSLCMRTCCGGLSMWTKMILKFISHVKILRHFHLWKAQHQIRILSVSTYSVEPNLRMRWWWCCEIYEVLKLLILIENSFLLNKKSYKFNKKILLQWYEIWRQSIQNDVLHSKGFLIIRLMRNFFKLNFY